MFIAIPRNASTHEVAATVRNNAAIDWILRETARANLRRHGRPPDQQHAAADLVLAQAALLAPAWAA